MQLVTYLDPNNQHIVTISMDVPRIGEQVGIAGTGAFVVANLRHVIANNAVRVFVWLTPVSAFMANLDEQINLVAKEEPRDTVSSRS